MGLEPTTCCVLDTTELFRTFIWSMIVSLFYPAPLSTFPPPTHTLSTHTLDTQPLLLTFYNNHCTSAEAATSASMKKSHDESCNLPRSKCHLESIKCHLLATMWHVIKWVWFIHWSTPVFIYHFLLVSIGIVLWGNQLYPSCGCCCIPLSPCTSNYQPITNTLSIHNQ